MEILRDKEHDYYYIDSDSGILEDEDGNAYHFNSYEEAEEFVAEYKE